MTDQEARFDARQVCPYKRNMLKKILIGITIIYGIYLFVVTILYKITSAIKEESEKKSKKKSKDDELK